MEQERYVVHGGLDPRELRALGIDAKGVLDFSANISPLGPPPGVRKALASVDVAAYPDRRCGVLPMPWPGVWAWAPSGCWWATARRT